MKKFTKKGKTIWAVAAAVALLAAIGGGVGYAVWKNTLSAQDLTDVPAADWNESAVYQVFLPLGADGAPLFAEPAAADEVASLAFVGYTGLEPDLRVPESAPISIGGKKFWKNVVKVLVLPEGGGGAVLYRNGDRYAYPGQSIGLRGNSFVTSLALPKTVVSVASGSFAAMRALQSVSLNGEDAIELGDASFSDCPKLTTLLNVRSFVNTDFEAAFANTPLL